jgi:hypothetical protein
LSCDTDANSFLSKQNFDYSSQNLDTSKNRSLVPPRDALEGVAATVMLHEPKWFQRRYTMMLNNVLQNLPPNWKLQIFYTGKGQSQAGIDINIGFQRFIRDKKVVLTLIPEALATRKRRKYQLMAGRWLWDNMMTDRVFLFGGNSVICANSPKTIRDFMHFDYIGTPWKLMKGLSKYSSIY